MINYKKLSRNQIIMQRVVDQHSYL